MFYQVVNYVCTDTETSDDESATNIIPSNSNSQTSTPSTTQKDILNSNQNTADEIKNSDCIKMDTSPDEATWEESNEKVDSKLNDKSVKDNETVSENELGSVSTITKSKAWDSDSGDSETELEKPSQNDSNLEERDEEKSKTEKSNAHESNTNESDGNKGRSSRRNNRNSKKKKGQQNNQKTNPKTTSLLQKVSIGVLLKFK